MACQAALHPCVGIVGEPDVKKTVGLEVELKFNLPSSCDETNQAAGQARVRGLWRRRSYRHFAVLPHAACNAEPLRLPWEVQTVS